MTKNDPPVPDRVPMDALMFDDDEPPSLMTAAEVARVLRIGVRSVYALASRGMLAHSRFGPSGRVLRFDLEDVEDYRAACRLEVIDVPLAVRPRPRKRQDTSAARH